MRTDRAPLARASLASLILLSVVGACLGLTAAVGPGTDSGGGPPSGRRHCARPSAGSPERQQEGAPGLLSGAEGSTQYASLRGVPVLLAVRCQPGTRFDELKQQAWDAWLDHRYADCDRLFCEAAQYGQLGEAELTRLSLTRRVNLGRSADSLAVARFNYETNPCATSMIEYAQSLADNADYAAARQLIAGYLAVPGDRPPEETLAYVLGLLGSLPQTDPPGLRDVISVGLREVIHRVAVKQYRIRFDLSAEYYRGEAREEVKRLGYQQFAVHADCMNQRTEYAVLGAERVEETEDAAGNRVLRVWPADGETPVVALTVTLSGECFDLTQTEEQWARASIPGQAAAYFEPTLCVDPSGPTATQLARRCLADTRLASVTNLATWWRGIEYTDPSDQSGSSEAMLRERKGHCMDGSRGEAAVLCAMGIPARQVLTLGLQVSGFLDTAPTLGCHYMTELWDPVYGWIQCDLPIEPEEASVRRRPLFDSPGEGLRLCAELPRSTESGPEPMMFRRIFYGWKAGTEPPDLENTSTTMDGLSFTELPPMHG